MLLPLFLRLMLLPCGRWNRWKIPLNITNNQYKSVTADLEEAKLDTGESLSIIKIISVLRELLA